MQIIIISSNNSLHKHWHISRREILLFIGLVIVACSAAIASFNVSVLSEPGINTSSVSHQADVITALEKQPIITMQNSDAIMQDYYAQRLGELQAESIRLKALTKKVAKTAGVDIAPFVLDDDSPQGGLKSDGDRLSPRSFQQQLDQLTNTFRIQGENLVVLQSVYLTNENIQSAIPQGFPLKGGWISSFYGNRIDPFTGKKVFHHGLDITGKKGSKIISVANGIVSWTGTRSGYGKLVEINHGNGYVTRYAHNKSLMVKVGERVSKGQALATMGSTGRSTGPHVHFELLLDGKVINPYKFVKN